MIVYCTYGDKYHELHENQLSDANFSNEYSSWAKVKK